MARTVVACLGDSITEGSPFWDARTRSGDPTAPWEHWAGLRFPGLELRNFGIWGERTDEIAVRFDEAVDGADAFVVQGGINDIAQGRPIEPAAETLQRLLERGLALGLAVAVCDVLPWNGGGPGAADSIRALNGRIRAFGLPLLPFHDTLADPADERRMKDEWTHEDRDHPSRAGYRRLGELAFRWPF
jgi:lysophospholipase L1-like esterase